MDSCAGTALATTRLHGDGHTAMRMLMEVVGKFGCSLQQFSHRAHECVALVFTGYANAAR